MRLENFIKYLKEQEIPLIGRCVNLKDLIGYLPNEEIGSGFIHVKELLRRLEESKEPSLKSFKNEIGVGKLVRDLIWFNNVKRGI